MERLRRGPEGGDTIATAVLSFYAGDDDRVESCEVEWTGDEHVFLLLPGIAIDEHLPYVRVAHGQLDERARAAVFDETQRFIEEAITRAERRESVPRWSGTALSAPFHESEATARVTISVRFSPDRERLWAETAFTPPAARDDLLLLVPRICWDWVFISLTHDISVAQVVLTDLLVLCERYRQNVPPGEFLVQEIGRAPYWLWADDDVIEDVRETATPSERAPEADEQIRRARPEAGVERDLPAPAQPRVGGSTPDASSFGGSAFANDEERENYWLEALEALALSGHEEKVPDFARQMALNCLRDVLLHSQGIGVEDMLKDVGESFADAWLLASEEDWGIVPQHAQTLIDGCVRLINSSRLAVGSDTIDRSDYSVWISIVLLGMHSDMDEWRPLNDYIRADGAWQRLESIVPLYLADRERTSAPPPGTRENWRIANEFAWLNGVILFLLDWFGLLSAQAGEREFGSGERPLSGVLFETEPDRYRLIAAQLTQSTAHAVPEAARRICSGSLIPLVNRKVLRVYGAWLRDTFECGYVLCVSETWDELDVARLRSMIDEGLRNANTRRTARGYAAKSINDPGFRTLSVACGIAVDAPPLAELASYVKTQGAFNRIETVGQFMHAVLLSSDGVKRRAARKLAGPLRFAFLLGVAVGVLDQLGELSASTSRVSENVPGGG